VGVCVRIRSGAHGDDGDGDGVGDGTKYQKHLDKKVGYVNVNISIKASSDLEPSISHNFHRLRVFN